MNWIKGWPVTFLGIGLFAGGCWMNSGIDAGLIAGGMCIIGAGIAQLVTSDD
jgi:hypothetical protein